MLLLLLIVLVEEDDLDRMCFVIVRFPVGSGPFNLNGGKKGVKEA